MKIKKPDACKGCPFYDKSEYITPDLLVANSTVMILAQNPGLNEEEGIEILDNRNRFDPIVRETKSQPLIGSTGHWLRTKFWPLTKVNYSSVSRANVIKCRPNGVNDLPPIGSNKVVNGITPKMLKEAIVYCTSKYLKIPSSIKYIMAMGSISIYYLTGEIKIEQEDGEFIKEGITDWRGSLLAATNIDAIKHCKHTSVKGITSYYHPSDNDIKIFPVIHIASLFQNPLYFHATLLDFIRFGNLVRGTWPEELPEIRVNTLPETLTDTIGFDTEYDIYDNNRLTMWSLSDVYRNVYVLDGDNRSSLLQLNNDLQSKPITVITQNGLVDLPHFINLFPSVSRITLEDCMLAHAVLWSGEPSNLDYMLSKVGKFNRHKHLRVAHDKDQRYLYAALDAYTTLHHVWYNLVQEFKKDNLSYQEYRLRRQPLLYIINKFQQKGLKVWRERVDLVGEIYDNQLMEINRRAKEITGNQDFNIASWQQVSAALYESKFSIAKEKKVKLVKEKVVKEKKSSKKLKRKVNEALIELERFQQQIAFLLEG